MTARQGPCLPQPSELPSIVFRALYSQFELRTIGDLRVAAPKAAVVSRAGPERDCPPDQCRPRNRADGDPGGQPGRSQAGNR